MLSVLNLAEEERGRLIAGRESAIRQVQPIPVKSKAVTSAERDEVRKLKAHPEKRRSINIDERVARVTLPEPGKLKGTLPLHSSFTTVLYVIL